MSVLDCRGLPCPEPVVRCRDWLAAPHTGDDVLDVRMDNAAAVQNVSNFLTKQGWRVDSIAEPRKGEPAEWRLVAVKGDGVAPGTCCVEEIFCAKSGKTLVFISTETLGRGDEGLGGKLMINFLGSLPELGSELWRIVLVNGGVKLAAGGPALEKLQVLAGAGVSILVCGTCLDHYGLLAQKQVGDTTNMLDIVTSLQLADKVIRP